MICYMVVKAMIIFGVIMAIMQLTNKTMALILFGAMKGMIISLVAIV